MGRLFVRGGLGGALVLGLSLAAGAAAAQDGGGLLNGAQAERRLQGGPGTVCTARNAMRTQQCTASCPSRETADCEDAEGGGEPTCRCSAD